MSREQQVFLDGINYVIACCTAYAQTPEAQDRLTDRFAARFRSTYLNHRGKAVTTPMVVGSVHQRLGQLQRDRDYQQLLRNDIDLVATALDRGENVDLAAWEHRNISYIRIGVTTRSTGINWGGEPWVVSRVNRVRLCSTVLHAGQVFARSVGWER